MPMMILETPALGRDFEKKNSFIYICVCMWMWSYVETFQNPHYVKKILFTPHLNNQYWYPLILQHFYSHLLCVLAMCT
jgi:hypothetical protein